jgi:rubrerythrin
MTKLVDELKNLSLKELLGYAIGSEEAAKKYYTSLAETIPHELAAIKFRNIAKEEESHRKAVLKVYKDHVGDENYTVPKDLPPLESSVEVTTVMSLIEALEISMKNERNAYDVYFHLAKEKKEYKKIFEYLANAEMGHYEVLKMEKKSYEGPVREDPKIRGKLLQDIWAEFKSYV